MRAVRDFLSHRGYLEVETPIARFHASMEPHLVSFETSWQTPDASPNRRLFLHTSPEYAMKRVLGEHGRSVFQLATVFRNEEDGPTHHREFTLLEWYRTHADYRVLMTETEQLVRRVARAIRPANRTHIVWRDQTCDLAKPFERLTVRDAFQRYAGLDPFVDIDAEALAGAAHRAGLDVPEDWSWEDIFHFILLERVEPRLGVGRATILYDYPARLAALAKTRRDQGDGESVDIAERFELYICGLELCNGFSELIDANEQRRRFESERDVRRELGLEVLAIDEGLLGALKRCPPCTGNALGIDRLLMLLLDAERIAEVRVVDEC